MLKRRIEERRIEGFYIVMFLYEAGAVPLRPRDDVVCWETDVEGSEWAGWARDAEGSDWARELCETTSSSAPEVEISTGAFSMASYAARVAGSISKRVLWESASRLPSLLVFFFLIFALRRMPRVDRTGAWLRRSVVVWLQLSPWRPSRVSRSSYITAPCRSWLRSQCR